MSFGRRAAAFGVDWVVIALWGGVLFGAVMGATGGRPPRPTGPWQAQGVGLLTMTLPVVFYFALAESSRWRGSLGKRTLGLVVAAEAGGRLPFRRSAVRNAIKLAPWELGHMVAQQAVFSGEAGLASWVWIFAFASFAGPVWWVLSILATGSAPYDRWAGARVAVPVQRPR